MRIRGFNRPVYQYSSSAMAQAFSHSMADDGGDTLDAELAGGGSHVPEGGSDDAGTKALADAVARADAADAKLAAHDADRKKTTDAAKAKDAKDRADKMIADGKASEEIKRLQDELTAATGKIEATEKTHRDTIDAKIEKLSDADKAEINAIKEHLPMAKLEELVTLKAGSSQEAPPADDKGGGSPTPGGGRMSKGRKLSDQATVILDGLNVDTEMVGRTEQIVNPRNPVQTKAVLPIKAMISKLEELAPSTVRLSRAERNRQKGQA